MDSRSTLWWVTLFHWLKMLLNLNIWPYFKNTVITVSVEMGQMSMTFLLLSLFSFLRYKKTSKIRHTRDKPYNSWCTCFECLRIINCDLLRFRWTWIVRVSRADIKWCIIWIWIENRANQSSKNIQVERNDSSMVWYKINLRSTRKSMS